LGYKAAIHGIGMTDKHFLFTMTAGRTGTAYLAELFRANVAGAECHHEILGWDRFGVDTPDVSHMTLYNSVGNHPKVRAFWQDKLGRIAKTPAPVYVETSHLLLKAGLVENLAPLLAAGTVHLVVLERDPYPTVISYRNRFDFLNKGMWWLWYLDPDYPRNILRAPGLLQAGLNGLCLWYILEMRSRARFYAKALAGQPRIRVHFAQLEEISTAEGAERFLKGLALPGTADSVTLPPPKNEGKKRIDWGQEEEARIRALVRDCGIDPEAVAEATYQRLFGQQLGARPAPVVSPG
jgi:hypothetical protein